MSAGVFAGSDTSHLPGDVWHRCRWDDNPGVLSHFDKKSDNPTYDDHRLTPDPL